MHSSHKNKNHGRMHYIKSLLLYSTPSRDAEIAGFCCCLFLHNLIMLMCAVFCMATGVFSQASLSWMQVSENVCKPHRIYRLTLTWFLVCTFCCLACLLPARQKKRRRQNQETSKTKQRQLNTQVTHKHIQGICYLIFNTQFTAKFVSW